MSSIDHRNRIEYIDGLRGFSIIMVLLHHAYGAWHIMFPGWAGHEPYSDQVTHFPPVAYGFLVVWLFFFISGYVILITLERCSSFTEFMVRRWIRLFPAMLICSILVFITAALFIERPMGMPHINDLLPGLTFFEPEWWGLILGRPQGILEGSFWSLFVEMRFYIVFGAAFFLVGEKKSIIMLIGLYIIGVYIPRRHAHMLDMWYITRGFAHYIDMFIGAMNQHGLGSFVPDTINYGMFASGTIFSIYMKNKDARLLALSGLLGITSGFLLGASDVYHHGHNDHTGMIAGVILLFVIPLSCVSKRMQRFWGNKAFLFMGFISYPLYLLHQNMMDSMIIKLHTLVPALPVILLPPIPIAIVMLFGWIIARFIEPNLQTVCKRLVNEIFPLRKKLPISSAIARS